MTTEEEHAVNGTVLTHTDIEQFQNDEIKRIESNAFINSENISPIDRQQSIDVRLNNNKSPTAIRTVEKLRISIPSMASPSSYYSSSSESHSPAHTRKVRKRYCYKCEIRFKHTVELLTHIRSHVTLPHVKLTPINDSNPFYVDYLNRVECSRKRKASAELNVVPLKIRLKIPLSADVVGTSHKNDAPVAEKNAATTKLPHSSKEGSIRILTAQEIKMSPPRNVQEMSTDAMISLGNSSFDDNSERRHFECPPLDGLSQFIDETTTGESTEQLLRKLLENSDVPTDTNNFDTPSNEFIPIENLAHMCSICKSSFPNANLLSEHERLTGHNIATNRISILEPIQEMVVEPLLPFQLDRSLQQQQQQQRQHQQQQRHHHQQHHPQHPQSHHPQQHHHQQQQQMRQMNFRPMPVGSYGQPPVIPIDQMTNQVRNFSSPPMSQAQRFGPMQFPVRRHTPPPLYRPNPVPNNNDHASMPNQPVNMAPFMSMNPDMYNPQPSNQPLGSPMPHQNPFMNSHLANQLMAPMQMSPSRLRSRLSMPPQMNSPRSAFHSPFMPPAQSSVPHNNFSPPLDMPNGRMQSTQRPNAANFASRTDPPRSKEPNRENPIISMAPPSAGLPIIQSVQSGVTVVPGNEPNRFQLSNQITLSMKLKDNSIANADSNAASNAVNILANRGILIKPTNKQIDSTTINSKLDAQKSLKCGTAEEAVQKLQLNNSVSIISKKKLSPSTAGEPPTIDLSNDEDKLGATTIRKSPAIARKATIKCPIKSCSARFVTVIALRQHTRTEHRLSSRTMKCAVCSAEFPTSIDLRMHHLKVHQKSTLGIPVVDLRKARTCQKLLELGILNFIPIENYTRHTENAGIGLALPIISIDGRSKNSLINLFGDELCMLPLNKISQIPKPKTTTTTTTTATTAMQRAPERTVMRTPDRVAQRTPDKTQPINSLMVKKPT